MNLKKTALLLIAASAVALQGCSMTAESTKREEMVVDSAQINMPLRNPVLKGAIGVGTISGGKKTNPLWVSNIDDASFGASLSDSLRSASLLAVNPANQRFVLDATLVSVDEPSMGFDMTVTTVVNYTLKDKQTGKQLWAQTISAPYTATTKQAFVGATRLRIAKEGSMRENFMGVVRALYSIP